MPPPAEPEDHLSPPIKDITQLAKLTTFIKYVKVQSPKHYHQYLKDALKALVNDCQDIKMIKSRQPQIQKHLAEIVPQFSIQKSLQRQINAFYNSVEMLLATKSDSKVAVEGPSQPEQEREKQRDLQEGEEAQE